MAGNAGITVQDIITEALGHLGVYQGDPLAAADLQSAFFTLRGLVDGWAAEPLTIFDTAQLTFSTAAGKQTYTIGAANTNDWIAPFLPTEFERTTMMTGTLELPIELATLDQWAAIAIKSMRSNIVTALWPDFGTVSHALNFWPVPNASIPINLYVPQQVSTFTATTNTVALPPGYQEALTFELAIKLSSKFGALLPSWLPEAWREAKGKIKAANFPILDARCDAALLSGAKRSGGGSIDFYLGR